jgi:acetylornithine deacetylase/succinyl-diaminopimelate desuccinylase-like protein
LQTAEKTFASFTLTAHNPGGHSSQPRPDNAIYDVADALQRVRGYAFPVMWNDTTIAYFRAAGPVTPAPIGPAMTRFAAHPGDRRAAATLSASPFAVGQIRTTCVPTLLAAGHADNALPQSAVATVNCRIFPGVAINTVRDQLQRLVGERIEVAQLSQTYTSSDASPLRQDVLEAVTAAVHANYPGVPVVPSMSAGATDGVFYRAAGIPTYGVAEIFIKDSDDFSHGLNERVPVTSFYNGLTHWRVLLTALAGPH